VTRCPCCSRPGWIRGVLIDCLETFNTANQVLLSRLRNYRVEREIANKTIILQRKRIVNLENEMIRLGIHEIFH